MRVTRRQPPVLITWLGPWLWVGLGLALAGCSVFQPIDYRGNTDTACDKPAEPVAQAAFPLSDHLPLPIPVLEQKLSTEQFTILEAKSTPSGTTSAMRLSIQFQDCAVLLVKWRAATSKLEAYNNNPRKELAAYAMQKLFLTPEDYVVPVTVSACIPAEELAKIGAPGRPQLEGSSCVLGPYRSGYNMCSP